MDKIVIVTGGSSGIGKKAVENFKEKKDIVFVLALDVENSEFEYKCDVSDANTVERIVNEIGQKYGHIDVLVNCAGYGISGALELIPTESAKKQFEVNVLGSYYMAKFCLKFMQAGSTIINIASACSLFPLPYRGLYCSSKSAINMLSHCLRMECKPFKVNVTSICPGDVKTNFTKNRIKVFETNERYGKRIENAAYFVDNKQEKRMPPEKVSSKIVKMAYKKHPKPMVIVGFKYKILYFASKIFPLSWFLHFDEKIFGGHKNKPIEK